MLNKESSALSGFIQAKFQAAGHSFELHGFVSLGKKSWDFGVYTSVDEFSINDVCELWHGLTPGCSKPKSDYNIGMKDTSFSISTA